MKDSITKSIFIGFILLIVVSIFFFIYKEANVGTNKKSKSRSDIPKKEFIPLKYDRDLKRVLVLDEEKQMYFDPQTGALFRPEIGDEVIQYDQKSIKENYEHQIVFDSSLGLDPKDFEIKYDSKKDEYYIVPKKP